MGKPTEHEGAQLAFYDAVGIALDNMRGMALTMMDLANVRIGEDDGPIFTMFANTMMDNVESIERAKETLEATRVALNAEA